MPYKRVLIIGDAGRGKSTFAELLAKKTGLPLYSTDDYFWEEKFTKKRNSDDALAEVGKIYPQDEWIVEGATRRLIAGGLNRADVVYVFKFKNLFQQYRALIARHLSRRNERLRDILGLLIYVTRKKVTGSWRGFEATVSPHRSKVVRLGSFTEINRELARIESLIFSVPDGGRERLG